MVLLTVAIEAPIYAALLRRRRPPMPWANGIAIGVTLQLVAHPLLGFAAPAWLAFGPTWAWVLTETAAAVMLEGGLVAVTLGSCGREDPREDPRGEPAGSGLVAPATRDRSPRHGAEGPADRRRSPASGAEPRAGSECPRHGWPSVLAFGLLAALVANAASALVERALC